MHFGCVVVLLVITRAGGLFAPTEKLGGSHLDGLQSVSRRIDPSKGLIISIKFTASSGVEPACGNLQFTTDSFAKVH